MLSKKQVKKLIKILERDLMANFNLVRNPRFNLSTLRPR